MIIKYDVIPEITAPYAAIIFPFVELILGFFLLIGFRVRAASLVLIGLMLFFTIAISINVMRGESFDCGCFELSRFGIAEKISISLIIRDIIFLLIFILLFFAKRHIFSLGSIVEKEDLSCID